jgi:hypothetical protein
MLAEDLEPFFQPDLERRIYAVQSDRLREVDHWLDKFRAFWLPRLDAPATEIAGKSENGANKSDGAASNCL